MAQNILKMLVSLLLIAGVASCGSSKTDRALSGGAIGAAASAAGAALLNENAAVGAAIGGAVGAAAGAAIDKDDVDLGDPIK